MAERRIPLVRRLGFLARLGHFARGLVYLAMGYLAVRAALATNARLAAGPDDALRWVLGETHGPLLVAFAAGGLFADAFLRIAEAYARRSSAGRLASLGRGAAAALLGVTALRVEHHVRRAAGDGVFRKSVAWVLGRPWGPRALVAVGAAAGVVAVLEIGQGVTGRLRERFRRKAMGRRQRTWSEAVSRVGVAAHGALVGVIGWFLVRAGLEADPRRVVGAGGALRRVERLPFGPGLLAAIAAGLVAYGLSQWILAVYRQG